MKLPHRRQFLHLAAGVAALPAVPGFAWAQAYPTRPVRIIVGFPAGGAPDIIARLMGQGLSERLGQQFVIENRPGAASNIGTEMVVKAPPDGYTLLMVVATNTVNATLYTNLKFNFIRDIAPVASIAGTSYGMLVNSDIGFPRQCDMLLCAVPARGDRMQYDQLKRRAFITLLGGTAVAWPLVTRAQQPAMPVIGFLNGQSPQGYASFLAAFLQGLKQAGYVDGQNAAIEYRWAQNQRDRVPGLAAELARHPLAVMVTGGGDHVVQAARAVAATTPIVSTFGFDPVALGLVASLNRPGGNITGVSVFSTVLVAKRLELLRELVPNVAVVAFLVNPTNPSATADAKDLAAAAEKLARRVVVLNAANPQECEAAFAGLARQGVGALLMQSDAFFNTIIDHVVALAKRHAVPVVYARREFAAAGGLLSYGSSASEAYRQLGIYTGQVLKGIKPADLPILLPTKFEFVINLTTAKALGIEVPLSLMLRADEMID